RIGEESRASDAFLDRKLGRLSDVDLRRAVGFPDLPAVLLPYRLHDQRLADLLFERFTALFADHFVCVGIFEHARWHDLNAYASQVFWQRLAFRLLALVFGHALFWSFGLRCSSL